MVHFQILSSIWRWRVRNGLVLLKSNMWKTPSSEDLKIKQLGKVFLAMWWLKVPVPHSHIFPYISRGRSTVHRAPSSEEKGGVSYPTTLWQWKQIRTAYTSSLLGFINIILNQRAAWVWGVPVWRTTPASRCAWASPPHQCCHQAWSSSLLFPSPLCSHPLPWELSILLHPRLKQSLVQQQPLSTAGIHRINK